MLIVLACGIFLVYETRMSYQLTFSTKGPSQMDIIVGSVMLFMILVCTRRVTGNPLPLICLIFLLYAVFGHLLPGLLTHKQFSWKTLIDMLMFTSEGLYGQPLSVSSSYVAMFVLFGAFLSVSGAGQWFIDMAFSLTGRARSGPAMTSIVSSAAMGTISGTGVAIVVATGSFTIPLMQSRGYTKRFSGAAVATAATGGQIMPPVMGASAFILAEMIGLPYSDVAIAAIIPAVLYFAACGLQVDFEAAKLGMKGLSKEELPGKLETFLIGWIYLVPLLVLIYTLCIAKLSNNMCAIYSIISLIVVALVFKQKGQRFSFKMFLQSLESGARDMVSVALACATAGIMIGILTKTGLGLKFTSLLLSFSRGNKFLTMLLTMICCVILGMGLPTTAAFIITSTLCAPALIQLGISTMAAYMFVFYFACMSAITPPVALAAYAASGISGASAWDTGWTATKLGLAGFVIPFFFCYNPAMLMEGTFLEIIQVCITSILGIICLAGGLEGFMLTKINIVERILLLVASMLLVDGGLLTDIVGFAITVIVVVIQIFRKNKAKNTPVAV